jgi:hypothetical protein
MTSATYRRRRKKTYHTPIGTFYYRDVPNAVYSHGVDTVTSDTGERYLVASAEKALLDELSTVAGVRSIGALRDLLLHDLRVDPEELGRLSFEDADHWASGYRSDAVDTFMGSLGDGRMIL